MYKNYSILMSVYKDEKPEEVKQSIDSMLNQSLKADQFVLVEDGPLTDELYSLIAEYERNNPNLFTIVELETNIGLGKALDKGIEYCKNELIARMDADDISMTERCQKQVQLFNSNSELDVVGTFIDEFYDEPKNIVSKRVVPVDHADIVSFMRKRSPFNHPTVMYKKSAVLNAGGYGKMRRKQDLDLFSRMINNGAQTANIPESLLLFRSNEDNFKRRNSWDYCKSYIEVQYAIWKRGHCSFFDLAYVVIGQTVLYVAPIPVLKWLSNRFLREKNKEIVSSKGNKS
ncbi:glycosyltransferase [Aerococcus sp. L_4]